MDIFGTLRDMMKSIVVVVTFISLLGCGTSPTAPGQTRPPDFDPAALFARLAGPYTLTFEANESCPLPPSLKVLTYDVLLEPVTRYRYLGVRVPSESFVGDLWALANEEEGFTLRWNVDCEVPDTVGATSFYLCGQGSALVSDGMISGFVQGTNGSLIFGVLQGANGYLDMNHRPFCANGPHRFVFQRRN
jgi:hypothetical protein